MPRRGRVRTGGRRKGGRMMGGGTNFANTNNVGIQVTRVPFCVVKQVTTAAALLNFVVALNPNDAILGASRLGGLADFWDSFRFTQLQVDVMPNSSNVEALLVGGYTDDVFTNVTPASVQDILQLGCKVYQTPNQSTPCRLRVPRSYLLRNTLKWWKSRGATDTFEGDQGTVVFLTSAAVTGSFNFIFSGVCEFKDPTSVNDDTANPDPDFPVPTWQVVQVQPPLEEQKEKSPDVMIRARRSASLPPVLERKAR